MKRFRVSARYFFVFAALFAVEVGIALFVNDRFVRPFVGDVLVVALIYCFALSFFDWRRVRTALCVFAFACAVELAQYAQLAPRLGIAPRSVLGIALGSHFDPADIFAYAIGAVASAAIDLKLRGARSRQPRGPTRARTPRRGS